jgi:hypothetical protein
MAALENTIPKVETVSINSLKRDFKLYPRFQVDFITVERFKDAMKAGAIFPPIRADYKTGRIIDGFHRYQAYSDLRVDMVDVLPEQVKDDADFFMRAVEANKAHGLGYSGADQEKIVKVAKLLKLEREKISLAMAIPVQKFDDLRRIVPTLDGDGPIKIGTHYRAKLHQMDRSPNKDIDRSERTSVPTGYLFFFNQAIKFLKSDGCDIKNKEVLYKLRELEFELSKRLNPSGNSLTPLVLPEPVKAYHIAWAERKGLALVNHVVEELILAAEVDADNSAELSDEESGEWAKKFRPFTVMRRDES